MDPTLVPALDRVYRSLGGATVTPSRVFQVDQMAVGSLTGVSVADAEAWLALERDTGRTRMYYNTKGWIEDARTIQRGCPWAATWYIAQDGVLVRHSENWDSSG
jgi:hypothetical protein